MLVPAAPAVPLGGGSHSKPLARQHPSPPHGRIWGHRVGPQFLLPFLTRLWDLHLVMQVPQPSGTDVEQLGTLGHRGKTGGGGNQAATAMVSQVDEQFGINAMGVGQGSLLFPKNKFFIKADMRGWSFL